MRPAPYSRSTHCTTALTVVPSAAITASQPDEKAELFEPMADKIYRHPTFYDIPDDVPHM